MQERETVPVARAQDEAIYLWISVADAPRFYELPWDDNTALELQTVMRDTRRKGVGVGMRLQELVEGAFENTEELRPAQKFYALPYSAPPEKQRVIESPKWEMYRAGRALKEDRAGFRVENMKVFNVNANTTRIPRLPQFGNLALDRHAILAKLSLDQHVAAKRLGDENFR